MEFTQICHFPFIGMKIRKGFLSFYFTSFVCSSSLGLCGSLWWVVHFVPTAGSWRETLLQNETQRSAGFVGFLFLTSFSFFVLYFLLSLIFQIRGKVKEENNQNKYIWTYHLKIKRTKYLKKHLISRNDKNRA